MAIGIQTEGGGGNFTPLVKINAKQGRVWRVDRTQDGSGGWTTDEVDITNDFQFVPDLENMEVGWMLFVAGQAPDLRMVPLGQPFPDRPSGGEHRQGVRLKLKLGKTCGGDLREIAATAKTILGPIDKLHDDYLAGAKSNPGKLPQVRMTTMKKIDTKTQHGTNTNFEPVFEIVSWVDRERAFPPEAAEAATEPKKTEPKKTEPAREMADAEEF